MSYYLFFRVVGADGHSKKFLRVIPAIPAAMRSKADHYVAMNIEWRKQGAVGDFDFGPNYYTKEQFFDGLHAYTNWLTTLFGWDMVKMLMSDMGLFQALHRYIESTHTSFERLLSMIFGDDDHPSKDPMKRWLVCGPDPDDTRPAEQQIFGGAGMVCNKVTTAEFYQLCGSVAACGVSIQCPP